MVDSSAGTMARAWVGIVEADTQKRFCSKVRPYINLVPEISILEHAAARNLPCHFSYMPQGLR